MRGAFGKPQGTVARVNIGQPIMSIRSKEQHQASCLEAFRRAKFKFPGRQKVLDPSFQVVWCDVTSFVHLDSSFKEMGIHKI